MKYSVHVEIERSRQDLIRLFDDSKNLFKWMDNLKSFEHLSGEPGHPGAKSKFVFLQGKREVEIVETFTVRSLPEEFTATYEARGAFSTNRNLFEEIGENRTRYTSEVEFEFKGFMKFIAFVMPGAFKKQSIKHLKDFKAFAESQ